MLVASGRSAITLMIIMIDIVILHFHCKMNVSLIIVVLSVFEMSENRGIARAATADVG